MVQLFQFLLSQHCLSPDVKDGFGNYQSLIWPQFFTDKLCFPFVLSDKLWVQFQKSRALIIKKCRKMRPQNDKLCFQGVTNYA